MLEAQESFGGTWLTHRFPGIRSDSDLYTFGYRFKPWTGTPIATAAEILKYMGEVIDENDLGRHIRYGHRIDRGELVERRQPLDHRGHAHRHRRARPLHRRLPVDVPGLLPPRGGLHAGVGGHGRLRGPHRPPADLAGGPRLPGKRVVVIGSGATAATLIPAMADDCAHVTMLQRSPTYFASAATPSRSPTSCASWRSTRRGSTRSCAARSSTSRPSSPGAAFAEPEAVKEELLAAVRSLPRPRLRHRARTSRRATGPGGSASPSSPTATCSSAIARGQGSVVTDEIERFTETGILLKSGKLLEADIIVTATGFNLSVLGDIEFTIDGEPLDLLRHRHLSRHDVHRRAQHGLGVRLLPRELDAAGRPGRRLRLPAARPHEGTSGAQRVAAALRPEDATCRCCRGSTRRTSTPAT